MSRLGTHNLSSGMAGVSDIMLGVSPHCERPRDADPDEERACLRGAHAPAPEVDCPPTVQSDEGVEVLGNVQRDEVVAKSWAEGMKEGVDNGWFIPA
ncbi:hypothetical protein JOB18_044882 [Solea senegalensis]|uniref:Uncharacterized protein n=1 Tax=Solea senegalensis TaxID=28829 RepID=A0AAV6SQP5_SOLSE|nr:hypothetical protein JOB18_044882 [Solea senegalensis]